MTTYVIDHFFILTVLVGYSNAHIKRKMIEELRLNWAVRVGSLGEHISFLL